jgi:tRNA (cmo5U34)-methyltransferase
VGQFHFTPERYDEWIRADVPAYDELQRQVAEAVAGVRAERILDLGVGTGTTARAVLAVHPGARLTGIDASAEMLERARLDLPAASVEGLGVARLEHALPAGPFDLVVSSLAVHHLDGPGKAGLFVRVADALRPGGRFVLGDVVVPERPEDAVTPVSAGFDFPDPPEDQLGWLEDAGFTARVAWSRGDLAVLVAELRPT